MESRPPFCRSNSTALLGATKCDGQVRPSDQVRPNTTKYDQEQPSTTKYSTFHFVKTALWADIACTLCNLKFLDKCSKLMKIDKILP